jgi:16S rRNA (guanine527-N7)-methyltransferase
MNSEIERLDEIVGRNVSRETLERLESFSRLLKAENQRQNLVSASTLGHLWERHILDSAQLARFEPRPDASWVDVGSGAGLPGIVIALLVDGPVTLVEPRRLRADFLTQTVRELGLNASVERAKAERIAGRFDVVTARAVAPLDKLLGITHHLSHRGTIWVLPKGASVKSELAEARRNWQCEVDEEASCTDPNSTILVLRKVGAKTRR